MKTRIFTTGFVLLMLVFNANIINAEGKKVSSINTFMASAIERLASENAIEEELEIEKWMYDENFFEAKCNKNAEDDLEIEGWMTSEIVTYGLFEVEEECELEIESWMYKQIDLDFSVEEDAEPDLEIEDWMLKF